MKDDRDKISFDRKTGEISFDGKRLKLPKKEYELIVYLIERPDVVHTKKELIEAVWGYDSLGQSSTLTVHINRLRERFKDNEDFDILTVRGLGYKAMHRQKVVK